MADTCTELKNRLDAANLAAASIRSGGGVRSVTDSDGSRIEYSTANLPSLLSYIALLQAQYDACVQGGGAVVTRPVQFFF